MNSVRLQNPHRIEYIDALRGFTMILVVFTHVEIFSFMKSYSSFIYEIIVSFYMPLFFFISGFMANKEVWNAKIWLRMCGKKMRTLLVPTLIFGIVYSFTYLKVDFVSFVTNDYKLGYWFTIVLCEMFILVYTMNFALYHLNHKILNSRKVIVMMFISILLYLVRLIPGYLSSYSRVYSILVLHFTSLYFPFFAFGYICSMYKDIFNKVLDHKYFAALVIISFAVLFYIRENLLPNLGGGVLVSLLGIIVPLALGIAGLLIVYNFFRVYADSFSSDKGLGRALQYIGKRTLDIYLLHYFFLPHIPQLGHMLEQGNNATLELALGGGISLLVIGLCLVVSNVLRTSPILAKYLFGAKTSH